MSSVTTIIGRETELIDVASIERELAGMWRSASEREQGAVTRACRGNLVVLTDGDQVPDFVSDITVRHPSRLLTVSRPATESDGEGGRVEGEAAPIQAYVSALCHMRPGGGLVCSERIALSVAEGAEARVASLVRGLILGDLPVTLLGPVEALDRYAGAGLLDVADQVMVDSTGASPDIWKRLAAALDKDSARLVDLAWHRLAGFRQVVAYAIARSPMRKAVNRLEAVDIAHTGRPTSALLVAAWLGQRLKWGRTRQPRQMPEPAATTAEGGPESPVVRAGDSEPFQRLELPGRGRRVRLRIGELGPPDDLVLVLRTSDIELRIGLNESESMATVAFGAGNARDRVESRSAGSAVAAHGSGSGSRFRLSPNASSALSSTRAGATASPIPCSCGRARWRGCWRGRRRRAGR
jgi:glucose-6-phosphate dehydrogenase assembly protein OpcA